MKEARLPRHVLGRGLSNAATRERFDWPRSLRLAVSKVKTRPPLPRTDRPRAPYLASGPASAHVGCGSATPPEPKRDAGSVPPLGNFPRCRVHTRGCAVPGAASSLASSKEALFIQERRAPRCEKSKAPSEFKPKRFHARGVSFLAISKKIQKVEIRISTHHVFQLKPSTSGGGGGGGERKEPGGPHTYTRAGLSVCVHHRRT